MVLLWSRLVPLAASSSAISLPSIPQWEGIHSRIDVEEDGGIICQDLTSRKHRRHPDDVRAIPEEAQSPCQEMENMESTESVEVQQNSESQAQTPSPEGIMLDEQVERRYPTRVRKPNSKYKDYTN